MIKAILFDFGQTLVDASSGFKLGEKNAQQRIFKDLGLNDWESFIRIYRNERNKHHREKIFNRVPFWRAIYIHYGVEPDESKLYKWENEYWEIVDRNRKLFPETKKVLQELSKSYKLGIVTNSPNQGKIGAGSLKEYKEIGGFFSSVVIAGTEQIPPKPDRKPFEVCLLELGVKPSNAIFVGDDLEIDIYGALNVGIRPIWLQHKTLERKWASPSIVIPIIHTLEELLYLDRLLDLKTTKKL